MGILSNIQLIFSIERLIHSFCALSIKAKCMGGRLVLFTFDSVKDKNDCCSHDSFLYEWFEKLMDWKEA